MAPDPSNLKVAKEISLQGIVFGLARVPESQRVYYGAADGKVYTADLAEEKPEAEELLGHESYVTGVALAGEQLVCGGYDCRLIWWDAENRAISANRSRMPTQRWIRDVRPRRTASSSPASPTTWSAACGTRRAARCSAS